MGEYEHAWSIWFNLCYFNVSVLFNLKHRKTDINLSAFKHFRGLKYAEPILDFWGSYAKLCRPGVGRGLWMKHICPCFTLSRIALAESARQTVSLCLFAMLSTRCFILEQESLRHSRYMIWLIWLALNRSFESVSCRLKNSCNRIITICELIICCDEQVHWKESVCSWIRHRFCVSEHVMYYKE